MLKNRNCPKAETICLIPGILKLRNRISEAARNFPQVMKTLLFSAENKDITYEEAFETIQNQIYELAEACSPENLLPDRNFYEDPVRFDSCHCSGTWTQKKEIEKLTNRLHKYERQIKELNDREREQAIEAYYLRLALDELTSQENEKLGIFMDKLLPELEIVYTNLYERIVEIDCSLEGSEMPVYLSETAAGRLHHALNEIQYCFIEAMKENEGLSDMLYPEGCFVHQDMFDEYAY